MEGKDGGIFCLFFGHVCVRQGKGKKGRGGCGSHRDLGNGWAGKGVSYHIFVARKVEKGCVEFGKERKVALLARGERSGLFGDGGHKWFVVSEKGERTTFKEKTEMFDRKESCEEFSVKSGIAGFSGGKFFGEEGKGLPGPIGPLL